jgi:hypothetical protein
MTLDELYATPGFYHLTTPSMRARGQYVAVEVDDKGVCHQLNKQDQRDGPLSKNGWMETPIVIEIKVN